MSYEQESESGMSTGAVNGSMYDKSMWQAGARMGPASPMNRSMINVNDENAYEQSKEYENSFNFNDEKNDAMMGPMMVQEYTRHNDNNNNDNNNNDNNDKRLMNVAKSANNCRNGGYSNVSVNSWNGRGIVRAVSNLSHDDKNVRTAHCAVKSNENVNDMRMRNDTFNNNSKRMVGGNNDNNERGKGEWQSFVRLDPCLVRFLVAFLVICILSCICCGAAFGYWMYDIHCREVASKERIEKIQSNNLVVKQNISLLQEKTVQMTQDLETMKQDTETMKQVTETMKQDTAKMKQDSDIEKQKRIAMEIEQWKFFINVFNNNSKMGLNQVIDISGNKSKFAADNVMNYCECINSVSIKQSKWFNQIWSNYDETSELSKCKEEYKDKMDQLREHPDREMYDEQVEMMTAYMIDNVHLNMNDNNHNEKEKEKEE